MAPWNIVGQYEPLWIADGLCLFAGYTPEVYGTWKSATGKGYPDLGNPAFSGSSRSLSRRVGQIFGGSSSFSNLQPKLPFWEENPLWQTCRWNFVTPKVELPLIRIDGSSCRDLTRKVFSTQSKRFFVCFACPNKQGFDPVEPFPDSRYRADITISSNGNIKPCPSVQNSVSVLTLSKYPRNIH